MRARSRVATAVITVLVALSLSACVGIPTSGSVNAGKVAAADDNALPRSFQPVGPQKGDKPEKIVQNFIQAALSPQDNYAIARSFLTTSVRQTWDPTALVTISNGAATPTRNGDSDTDWVYPATEVAQIDAAGVYTELPSATQQPVSFTLVQVAGQWRISDLKDGIVISNTNFDSVFAPHPLFFFEPSYQYLVPDMRWFPTTDKVTTRVANALLAGPSAWLGGGILVTAFPTGTTLGDAGVTIDSAAASVDLSDQARDNVSAQDRGRMEEQMTASLTGANVSSVALTVGGVDLTPPGSVGDASSGQPSVSSSYLVRQGNTFGFTSGDQLTSIKSVSNQVVNAGAVGAAYAARTSSVAIRTLSGVSLVQASGTTPTPLDSRANLIDPSIDNDGFVWSAQHDRLSSLKYYAADGTNNDINTSSLGGDDPRVISIEVSRDGARVLLYLDGDSGGGPRLVVAGVVRGANNAPTALGVDPISLPVSAATPIDATWESDRAVAAISLDGVDTSITEFEIGGPSTDLGVVQNAVQIVGGNGGSTGLRVLDAAGGVFRSNTPVGWRSAGLTASFIATQQPG